MKIEDVKQVIIFAVLFIFELGKIVTRSIVFVLVLLVRTARLMLRITRPLGVEGTK